MPFIARCACGLAIEGDCSKNGYLAIAPAIRHLLIESGKITHDSEITIESVPISRPWGTRHAPSMHSSEVATVWEHPGTKQVRYPDRNDRPMPTRYRQQGFERRELKTLREVERFERERGVQSEAAWFNRGSGRSFLEEG